jgi:hypothetical protein
MTPSERTTPKFALGAIVPVLVFLAIAVPLWISGFMKGRGAADQVHFHVRVIEQFAKQWPRPDLSDYPAAMSPGYHLLLTPLSRMVGIGTGLQIVASVFTIVLLGLFGTVVVREGVRRGHGLLPSVCAALPLACSMYVLFPGVWLQPDNAAWLLVLGVITLTTLARQTWMNLMIAGVLLALLVFTRQSHLWLAGVIWAAAWLMSVPGAAGASSIQSMLTPVSKRMTGLVMGGLLTLPAFVVFAWLYQTWGGVMPAQQRWQFPVGFNWATPAFVLSLIGVYSVFLIGWVWPGLARAWRESRALVIIAGVIGVIIAAIPETTFLREPRSSGLWNLVGFMDARGLMIAGWTSPLLLVLSGLGSATLVGWLRAMPARRAWMFMAILVGFTIAQTANALCWQRYIEPLLLIVLGLMCVSTERDPLDHLPPSIVPARILGPLTLAGVLLLITAQALWTAQPPAPEPPNPSQITDPLPRLK